MLAGALSGLLQVCKTSSDSIFSGCTVLDDSSDEHIRQENRKVLSDASASGIMSLNYFGKEEKQQYLNDLLSDSGPDVRHAAMFALFGCKDYGLFSPGGNRNSGLLYHVGKICLSIDDDVMPIASRLKEKFDRKAEQSLENSSLPLLFLPAGNAKRLEKLLTSSSGDQFRELAEGFKRVLGGEEDGRIAMAGIRGGRWYSNPWSYVDIDPSWARILWANKKEFQAARFNPYALLLAPKEAESSLAYFVTTCYGWKGTAILPPFFPLLRGDDAAWAQLVRICYPGTPVSHLPFCVDHLHNNRLEFSDADFNRNQHTLTAFITQYLEYISPDFIPMEPADCLVGIGQRLVDLSGLASDSLSEFIISLNLKFAGYRIQYLTEKKTYSGGSRLWLNNLQEYIQQLKVQAAESWIPRDFLEKDVNKAEAHFREYLRNIGELLLAWPEIWHKAYKAGGDR